MEKITCLLPFHTTYVSYQQYYVQGLCEYLGRDHITFYPRNINFAPILVHRQMKRLDYYILSKILKRKYQFKSPYCKDFATHTGQYIYSIDKDAIKIAIDAHDHRDINSEAIFAWSDIYFKANTWKTIQYPEKVFPIVNGNGSLTKKKINQLISLRTIPKEYDVVYISRIWDSREHDIRIFEELVRQNYYKVILAIIPKPIRDETRPLIKRLDLAGVPWTDRYLSQKALWEIMAKSRIVILRAGMHYCIPWRAISNSKSKIHYGGTEGSSSPSSMKRNRSSQESKII